MFYFFSISKAKKKQRQQQERNVNAKVQSSSPYNIVVSSFHKFSFYMLFNMVKNSAGPIDNSGKLYLRVPK